MCIPTFSGCANNFLLSGWYLRLKGLMENGISGMNFGSVAIFRPAMIYPGNTNTPSFLGPINQSLNWLLPGAYNSVGSSEIASAMVRNMVMQLTGELKGVRVIEGGKAIAEESGI